MVAAATSLLSIDRRLTAQENFSPFPEDLYPSNPRAIASSEVGIGLLGNASSERLFGPLLASECGVTSEPMYYCELFTNARGGISTKNATQYEALLDLPITFDFKNMHWPLPGRFFLLAQNTHGRGLTEDFVGDTQVVSNIDSFNNIMQISEYWWEYCLFCERLAVRLGKQDVNTEFLAMDLASDFIQSSFGLSPSAGFPSYPDASMAAVLLADLTESTTLKVGVWDALADGGGWGFSGNDVHFVFGELEYKYALGDGRLPGALDLGIGYVSSGEVSPSESLASGYGYYIQIEQLVMRENPCCQEDMQGLGVFFSYFPRFSNGIISISAIGDAMVGGVVYKGLIPGRNEDVVGAGFAWAELFQGGTNEETVVEVFYKAQVTPWMGVQPDIQYIKTPSGIHPDALVVGLRAIIVL